MGPLTGTIVHVAHCHSFGVLCVMLFLNTQNQRSSISTCCHLAVQEYFQGLNQSDKHKLVKMFQTPSNLSESNCGSSSIHNPAPNNRCKKIAGQPIHVGHMEVKDFGVRLKWSDGLLDDELT